MSAARLRTQADGWYIYEVRDPLPRAFVAPATRVIADDEEARQQIAAGTINPLTTAVVDHPVDCPSGSAGQVAPQMVRYEPNAVEIDATGPGVLILTDSYDPNWAVTVDTTPAEPLRVDTALRGVCLKAGAHRVRFEYQPVTFRIGVLVSLAGWIVLGLLGAARLVGLWRVRRI